MTPIRGVLPTAVEGLFKIGFTCLGNLYECCGNEGLAIVFPVGIQVFLKPAYFGMMRLEVYIRKTCVDREYSAESRDIGS